jgi:hypothetical protein
MSIHTPFEVKEVVLSMVSVEVIFQNTKAVMQLMVDGWLGLSLILMAKTINLMVV